MIKKIEHVGVAVKDLGKSEELFKKLLGKQPYNKEELKTEGISISFFKIGDQKIELLASASNKSPIKKFVEKRKEGIHHIALHVDSIQKEVERLESLGFELFQQPQKRS